MANTGINIPQLNSMITFRGLGIITGQQTYGRISRQLKDKEWAWVLIPNISLENKDTKEQLKLFISYLRSLNNNYDPVQQYNEDKFQGLGEEEEPEGLNNSKKNKKQKRSPLDELIFEIENEEIAKLELSELISGLGELMKESDFII
jgi:predicted helicase